MFVLRSLTVVALVVSSLVGTAQADDAQIVQLEVSPAARPEPVMRYRLAPTSRELVPGNAAALYYRAILTMQSYDHLGDSDDHRATRAARDAEWLELAPGDLDLAAAHRGLDGWDSVLKEASLGARRTQVVWDLPLREVGIATSLHEQGILAPARLLALQAKVAVAEGRFDDAAAALATLVRMSEHVNKSGMLINSLVGIVCESLAMAEVEQWIGAPGSPNLYWALTALPDPPIDTALGLESEQLWIHAEIPYLDLLSTSILSEKQSRELTQRLGDLLTMVFDGPHLDLGGGLRIYPSRDTAHFLPVLAAYPAAKRELIARGRDAAEVAQMSVAQVVMLRWTEEYRDRLDEMLVWSNRPFPEVHSAFEEIESQVDELRERPTGYLAAMLLPATQAARRAEVRLEQRVAMLRVIEAMRMYAASHGGRLPARLDEITAVPIPLDPACGEPFLYEFRGATATLRSSRPDLAGNDPRYEITVRK